MFINGKIDHEIVDSFMNLPISIVANDHDIHKKNQKSAKHLCLI